MRPLDAEIGFSNADPLSSHARRLFALHAMRSVRRRIMTSSLKGKDPNASGGRASDDATAAGPESQMQAQSSRRPRQPSKPDIPMPVAVSFNVEGETTEPATGFIARLSIAGVDIETFEAAPPIGSLLVMRARLDPNAAP